MVDLCFQGRVRSGHNYALQLNMTPGPGSRTPISALPRSALARISFSRSRLHRSRLFDLVQVFFLRQLSTVGTACNYDGDVATGRTVPYMRT